MAQLMIGSKVQFGRNNGERTEGTVVKINAKSVKVRQDETRSSFPVGTVWSVARKLVRQLDGTSFDGAGPTATSVPTQHVGADPTTDPAQLMRLIADCYGDLSPENLTCDGELRGADVARRAARINNRLNIYQHRLGRRVSEEEAYAACFPPLSARG